MIATTEPQLTDRQREVLRAILTAIASTGRPPSYRELMKALGITTPNGVTGHTHKLRKKGFIDWKPTKARTLRVLGFAGICRTSDGHVVPAFTGDAAGVRLMRELTMEGQTHGNDKDTKKQAKVIRDAPIDSRRCRGVAS